LSRFVSRCVQDFGWSPTVSGLVQSSFFWGYALSQIPGGYLNSNIGGRRVLPSGVGVWSAATAAVPFVAGSLPGQPLRHAAAAHHATAAHGSPVHHCCNCTVLLAPPECSQR